MADAVFRLQGIQQKYNGLKVLDIDQLEIPRGGIFCLLGPSGAGKSTFLRIINLVEKPAAGILEFNGRKIDFSSDLIKDRRKMAMVFQEPLLFNCSVQRNIGYGLRTRRIKNSTATAKVIDIARVVGVDHLLRRHAYDISGGEAQRVSLARAMAVEPQVLLMDEPFANLDVPNRNRLKKEVKRLVDEMGLTLVLVTHDQEVAFEMADRLAVLSQGVIEQQGRPSELYLSPHTRFLADFFGVENIFSGIVEESEQGLMSIDIDGCSIQAVGSLAAGSRADCFIRAEDVYLHTGSGNGSSARNRIVGHIEEIRTSSALAFVRIKGDLAITALITKRSLEDLRLTTGDQVTATFKATAVVAVEHHGKDEVA